MSSTENTLDRPFGDLMARLGLSQEQLDASAGVEGEAFMAHAAFERQRDALGATRYEIPTDCEGTLRIVDDTGALWLVECDQCRFEVGVAIGKADPKRLLERRLASAGIPSQFAEKDFDNGDAEQQDTLSACRTWLRQFRATMLADSIPAVALWGKPGRGKSHLLSLMVRTLVERSRVDAMYRSCSQLFDELQAGMDEGSYEIRWQRVLRVSVLALDDLGAGRWSDWQRERFATLVDHRFSRGLPLLVATNIPPGGWPNVFGERTDSRLRGMCLRFELAGPDRRVTSQQSLLGASA